MALKCSNSVEILPSPTIDWLCGSTKTSSVRIAKNGRNVAMKKIKQPNKTGADPKMFSGAGEKWRSMTKEQKQPWAAIAEDKSFRSPWNAFISSFLKSVALSGIDYTMSHELTYIDSDHRQKKAKQLANSIKRLNQYEVKESFYSETEETLAKYPVNFSSEHIYVRLQDYVDVNIALELELLYRTDDFAEYQYESIEKIDYIEKGSYILTKRPRQGQELFQPVCSASG